MHRGSDVPLGKPTAAIHLKRSVDKHGTLSTLHREHGLVAVARWLADAAHDGFIKRVLQALG